MIFPHRDDIRSVSRNDALDVLLPSVKGDLSLGLEPMLLISLADLVPVDRVTEDRLGRVGFNPRSLCRP